jgi:predicted RNA-binding protein with PUA-like domain
MAERQHWLMKSEPDELSIDDLARVGTEPWTGVRNYAARGFLRAMRVGDAVLFHHSSVQPPGVAGIARVARTGVVDETQFDPRSDYYDPRATRQQPIWDCVEVEWVEKLPHFVSMERMRADPRCADMMVLRRGMRLSVQPVTAAQYAAVVALGRTPPEVGDVDVPRARRASPPRGPAAVRLGRPEAMRAAQREVAAGVVRPRPPARSAAAARPGPRARAAAAPRASPSAAAARPGPRARAAAAPRASPSATARQPAPARKRG